MEFGHRDAVLIGLGAVEPGLELTQFRVSVEHVFERRPGIGRGLLSNMGDDPVARPIELAAIRVQLAQDRCEQAGFAAAVGTGDAQPLAGIDAEVGLLKQQPRPAAKRQLFKSQHRRIRICSGGTGPRSGGTGLRCRCAGRTLS